VSVPTPLLDFIRRGQAAHDVRRLAAQGALAPRAQEQLAILVHLLDDSDPVIRQTAADTLSRIPIEAIQAHLGRPDVAIAVREYFADRGVFPSEVPTIDETAPLISMATDDDPALEGDDDDEERESAVQRVSKMNFTQRLRAALKGPREMRAILIRDPNKSVAAAVLSSPKVNEPEIESFARMANVCEDVLRMIGSNRVWMRNYAILLALTRNPKTPVAMSLNLLSRLNDRDAAMLSVDRNIPEPLRIAARRRVVDAASSRR
jgi:hypothetical protein